MSKNCTNVVRHHQQLVFRVQLLEENKIIRPNVAHVLLALASFANAKGFAFPSQSTLAKMTGYKRETINRLLNKAASLKFISKTQNRKPFHFNGKTYCPRVLYKFNIGKITKLVGDEIRQVKKALNTQKKASGNDHSAIKKTDHTNKPSAKTNLNTTAENKSRSMTLNEILSNAILSCVRHQTKINHTTARKHGLKRWRIENGLEKCPKQLAKEQSIAKKRVSAAQTLERERKPVRVKFEALVTLLRKSMFNHDLFKPKLNAFKTLMSNNPWLELDLVSKNILSKIEA